MLNFLPSTQLEMKPKITVVGVGGAGGNAVNNMIASQLSGVEFVVANTDAQALAASRTERRIQLGEEGLGAGAKPDVGRVAAEHSLEKIVEELGNANMVFITAGMGGGTGSGAAPVIARAAREQGILTVGVVTKPFSFEGAHRMRNAEAAIEELSQFVDTLIIIPNQNLFLVANERTTFADAFKMADHVLYSGVRSVTDLMMMPGLINLDFADVSTVMSEMGKAMMGTGEAEGDNRAIIAAEAAISNPLLDDTSMKGARAVLINVTAGRDLTLFEVDAAANRIREEVDAEANIIFGSTLDESLEGKIRVSVVATGINKADNQPTTVAMSQVKAQPVMQALQKVAKGISPNPAPAAPQPVLDLGNTTIATAPQAMAPVAPKPTAAEALARANNDLTDEPKAEKPVVAEAAETSQADELARAVQQVAAQAAQPQIDPALDHDINPATERREPTMTDISRALSDIADKQNQLSHRPQPVSTAPAKKPGLLGRLLGGLTGKNVEAEQPQPQRPERPYPNMNPGHPAAARPHPAHTHQNPAMRPQPNMQGQNSHQPQPAPRPQMRPADTTPSAPPAPTGTNRPAEDLDIPAFLRRQAN